MTMGGGTFSTMNRIIPGVYYKIQANATMEIGLIDRGVVAVPLELPWGNLEEIITVDQEYLRNLAIDNPFLIDFSSYTLLPVREILVHAKTCYVIPTGGVKASCVLGSNDNTITVEARKAGTLGNQLMFHFTFYTQNTKTIFSLEVFLNSKMVYVKDSTLETEEEEDLFFNQQYLKFPSRTGSESSISDYWTQYAEPRMTNEPTEHILSGGSITPLSTDSFNACCQVLEDAEYEYNVMVTNYQGDTAENAEFYDNFETWLMKEREEKGNLITGVVYDVKEYNNEYIVNVSCADTSKTKTPDIVFWVAGATADATAYQSITNMVYDGEMTTIATSNVTSSIETALKNGNFLFYHQLDQYRVVKDINSLHTIEDPTKKNNSFKKNIVVRIIDQVLKETMQVFSQYYLGKAFNNAINRIFLKNDIVSILRLLEGRGCLENVTESDVVVARGTSSDEVLVNITIRPVDVMEILYVTLVIEDTEG